MNEEPFVPGGMASPGAQTESTTGSATQSARSEFEKMRGATREQGAMAVERAKEGARSAAQQAREFGQTTLRNQKENLARKVSQYADATRAASDRFRAEEGNVLTKPTERAAEELDRFAHYLQEKEPADLLDDFEALARRRPEVVFGGLFVAGLAVARFLKASRRRPAGWESAQEWRESIPRSAPAPSPSTQPAASTSVPVASSVSTPSTTATQSRPKP